MNAKPLEKKGVDLGLISKYRNELYGIAIILILLFHFAGTHVNHYGPIGADSFLFVAISSFEKYVGSVGVELFVFLSGMSMYYSYTRNSRLLSFYSKRYQRILIPYIYI